MATPLETLMLSRTGIVTLYALNETSGTVAVDSKGANNGTYQNIAGGGYVLNQAGIIPSETMNCPTFVNAHDGCVTIPAGVAPTATGAYTWEAWVFPTSSTLSNMRVLGHDDGSANGPSLMWDKPNNQWHTWRSSPAAQLSANAGPASARYHIVKTYDGRVLRLVVNGQSRGGIIDTTSITTVGGQFIIGATGGFGNSWDGKIQYVATYNVALTGAQIREHYLTGLATLPAANTAHSYGAYVNTGQSWDASPPTHYGEMDTWTGWATNNGASAHKPGLFHCFCNYANNAHFPKELAKQANQRGADLLVTWEAWDPNAAGTGGHKADQPAYSLQNIANTTNFDAYLTTWANDIKAYGYPVFLRLFHEFNGDYYPWGVVLDANNNNQSDYVTPNTEALVAAAFRKVRGVFTAQGVTNARFVWCPNVFLDNFSNHPFTSASYPGDAYVDYAGLDGYNTSSNSSTTIWLTFFDLYSQAYDVIASITSKPIIVPEMACAEDSTAFYSKSGWITQGLGIDIPQAFPAIAGVLWEDDVNYPAYPSTISIDSSPAALAAFQAQVAGSGYALGAPLAFAAPSLTGVSPTSQVQGSAFTLTCTGAGFTYDSVAYWGGTALATTFVNSTSLTAAVTSAQTATAGTVSVTVQTPSMATTAAQTFTVTAGTTSTLTSVSPTSQVTGSAFTLTGTGTNFAAGSVVYWGATALATTFVSVTTLTAAVTTTQTASAGAYAVTVQTPGVANAGAVTVTINAPATPVLAGVGPTSVLVGSAATLTATGSGFTSTSVVDWGVAALTTTYGGPTTLTAAVTTAQTAAVGSFAVVVATPGLATTEAATVAVVNPTPAIATIAPTSAVVGAGDLTLTVSGTGFVAASVVQWNGAALPTTYVSATRLTAVVPHADFALAGVATVTVQSP